MAWQWISSEVTVKGPMQWKGLIICCGNDSGEDENVRSE